MDDESNIKDYILVAVLLLGIGVGAFGGANWAAYVAPSPPMVPLNIEPSEMKGRLDKYNEETSRYERGEGAVIPRVVAIPICLMGFGAAIISGFWLMGRNT